MGETAKGWLGRSLVSGILLLVLQAGAVLAEVWGTPSFGPVLRLQIGAVLLGVAELVRRQMKDPVQPAARTLSLGDGSLRPAWRPEDEPPAPRADL